jgi:hypothetical protein
MNLSVGIVQDREAHLDDVFRINDLWQIGPNLKTALEIRWGTITYDLHIQRFEMREPGQKVVAFVGNGNLLFNDHFVAWIDGKLYHLRDEPLDKRVYSSIVVWRDGHVSIEDLCYQDDQVLHAESGKILTSEIKYATFGQRLIREGIPVDWNQLLQMTLAGQFTDLRHLLRFPALQQGPIWSDIGLDEVHGDPKLLHDALEGKHKVPIKIDIPKSALEGVLEEKGYMSAYGDYEIEDDTLWLRFKRGIYPHNMIGVKPDGTVLSVVVTGLSNRVGITIEGAAQLLQRLGIKDGILLDNGGDVMMQFFGEMVVTSAEQGRRELRSVILYTKARDDLGQQLPDEMGIKLMRYPPL